METEEVKQQAQELISRLHRLVDAIEQGPKGPELASKKEQLDVIRSSIRRLEKRRVEIPADLRRMRTSLAVEVAAAEEKDAVRELLSMELSQILSQVGKRRPASGPRPSTGPALTKRHYRGTVGDLIASQLLKESMKLVHRTKKGNNARAYYGIVSAGSIEVEVAGQKRKFETPSAAATALTGSSINGWDWWYAVLENGEEVTLSELRTRLTQK